MNIVQADLRLLSEHYQAVSSQLAKDSKAGTGKSIRLPQREFVESLTINTCDVIHSHDDLLQLIRTFSPESGWVCSQSRVDYFNDGQFSENLCEGSILNGEFAVEGSSLHINTAASGWRATLISEAVPTLVDGEWKEPWNGSAIAEEQRFITTDSTRDNQQWAIYRVFYGYGQTGLSTIASRFSKLTGDQS